MGKAYRISGDEKYAKEWAFQYIDWIKKNPLVKMEKENFELVSAGTPAYTIRWASNNR